MEGNAVKLRRPFSSETGFSVFELTVVVSVIFILIAFAVVQLRPTLQQMTANAGLDEVKSGLRQARELAISQRRTILLQFLNSAPGSPCSNVQVCLALTEMQVIPGVPPAPPTEVAAPNPFQVLPIEGNVGFLSFNGEPDTPDAFIGLPPAPPNGVYNGGTPGVPPTGMQFNSDGSFTNGNGDPINLTIFLGEANVPTTARAITILGNTGKVSWYQGTGSAWSRI
jgi:hypothetical protein